MAAFNPYDILNVSQAASKAEILAAKVNAIKQKQYPLNVIADAEKKLLKPKERILADYLRPILPIVKRFRKEDLSSLLSPAPALNFITDFDDLDSALLQSLAEEKLEQETLQTSGDLLRLGIEYSKQSQYLEAIKSLQEFSDNCNDFTSKEYLQAQMYLVKAHQALGNIQTTIKLCQELIKSENSQVQNWAKSVLNSLIIPEKPKVTLQICIDTFNQGNYLSAINLLEELRQNSTDITQQEHLQAQMYLVKAYHSSKQTTKAIALCQQLTQSDNIQVKNWALQTLNLLKGN